MDDAAEKGMNQDTSGDETWQEATKRGNTAKVICSGWLGPSISFVKFFFFTLLVWQVGSKSWVLEREPKKQAGRFVCRCHCIYGLMDN